MSEKKQEGFTVTDRRLFTPEGEVRSEPATETQPAGAASAVTSAAGAAGIEEPTGHVPPIVGDTAEMPPTPTAEEQQEQHDAYQKSAKDLDTRVELSGHSAKELEVSFERFMASLYMSAMLQLGLMHEQGGAPRIDLIGARQTIDTLGLLQEKTKGNLTSAEGTFLQNCLYELRMAYVEVTNALARAPEPAPGKGASGK